MDYRFCNYEGRFVYSTKEYLDAYRNDYFYVRYNYKNRKKMLEEIERIMDFNKSADLYALAHLLYDDNLESNNSRAFVIADLLVSWNYAPALYLVGQMYFYGLGVEKDINKFFEFTKKSAESNFMIGKNALAVAYLNGIGCAVNHSEGRKLLSECIECNYGLAYFNLGQAYLTGKQGYPKDETKGFEYVKIATNHYISSASYRLGVLYLNGTGCTKNVKKAVEELGIAASLGSIKAQVKLGDLYYFGEEIKKDFEKAYSYYLMSAEQGDPYSMYSLGYMIVYKQKAFVEKYEGISWLQKAAYEGYEDAIELLKKI